ncbi:sulfatase-like hydrolase/transferase [Oceanispirochaeta sp.]|jgi:arylsulfatase|uniref:sulfatase-like hydrolase/transferase n=1 Tax=Oceanispirochaeta sp. TaxID=2035350 RepID=UPI00260B9FCE|nr:sulfatase-like hydrolase/transferase [Oceanispirochaeta sp.]MDA3955100.1 sulfatase-like hydrolase/transferase [Oceanispirochaeta sp.]
MSYKPNVLLINTDHWPASLMGITGHPSLLTPTLNSLARDGIRFQNAYSECPVCIPARRSLMTGTSPRTHGDRVYTDTMEMPDVPTLAETFGNNGYQTFAVGKLHVYPQRNRIGFDDALITEEARYDFGVVDDYQIWLGEQGYTGQEFMHGMGNNNYQSRPWHLPEETHQTNWITREMIKVLKRRDPGKPGFYYLSYPAPHPPLVPLQHYFDLYSKEEIPEPLTGDWNGDNCYALKALTDKTDHYSPKEKTDALRAFYGLCTHIDHQIRLVIGTLREMSLLENTIIMFISDHGDMLFNHKMLAKRVFYEGSANIPCLISGKPVEKLRGQIDNRLVCLADVMPTLLDLCGLIIPDSVEGLSAVRDEKRSYLYGEIGEGDTASRMIHDGRFKLIYYPLGNYSQLFDLQEDPTELHNLSGEADHADKLKELQKELMSRLYKEDSQWIQDASLQGLPDKEYQRSPDYSLYNQRGGHWPPPSGYGSLGKS